MSIRLFLNNVVFGCTKAKFFRLCLSVTIGDVKEAGQGKYQDPYHEVRNSIFVYRRPNNANLFNTRVRDGAIRTSFSEFR